MPFPAIWAAPLDTPANALNALAALPPVNPWAPDLSLVPRYSTTVFPSTPVTYQTVVKTSLCPYGYWLVDPTNVVVVIGGTDGTQVPALLSSWLSRSSAASPQGANGAYYNAALEFFGRAPDWVQRPGLNWWLVGHSFGGAILEVLGQLIAQRDPTARVTGWTFGSPRPGDSVFQRNGQRITLMRYFCTEDVVPVIPPHSNEGPILYLAVPDQVALYCNELVQPPNGRQLAADGTITRMESTSLPLSIVEPSLGAWVLGLELWQAQSHSPAEYARRLALSPSPERSIPGPNRTPPASYQPPLDISVRQLHRQIDAAVAALPTETIPPGLPQMIGEATTQRYRIRHRRGGWGVWYRGQMVALCKTKRAARKIARTGNAINTAHAQLLGVKPGVTAPAM